MDNSYQVPPSWSLEDDLVGGTDGTNMRVLMGVPNCQLTTNFSSKCQLTTIFWPIVS